MGGEINFRLLRERRRTLSLTVTEDGEVLVKAPLRLPNAMIEGFVREKSAWIDARKGELRLRPRYSLADGEALPLCGGKLFIKTTAGRARIENGAAYLPVGDRELRKAALERLIREAARSTFQQRIACFSSSMGVTPGRLTVSGAKTRWGSCGKGGSINLNWRLILAPPECLDYVVVHELCHLRHRDHSKNFWAMVERTLPDYRQRRIYLNQHRWEFTI